MPYSALLHHLDTTLTSLTSHGTPPDETTRRHLLSRIETLQEKLQNPMEFTMRTVFGSHRAMLLRLAVDMKLFDAIAELGGVATTAQMAKRVDADGVLVARVARFLAVMGVLRNPEKGVYHATELSDALRSSSPLAAGVVHGTLFLRIMTHLPTYFQQTGYVNPSDAYSSPFQHAFQTQEHFFTWLSQNPIYQTAFNTVMSLDLRRGSTPWYTLFPAAQSLTISDPSRALIVDIGGGQGADLLSFRDQYPDMPGRVILQDLPSVVSDLHTQAHAQTQDKLSTAGIEIQEYDFFTPQPVNGAKAYFLRTVLHDWPDKQAAVILGRVRDAMVEDSVLLVNEVVLPEGGEGESEGEEKVDARAVQTDLVMMCGFAGMERTVGQFGELFGGVGLELVRVWGEDPGKGGAVVLEVRVKRCAS
ncbi:S-adenosyl-L-methionine-dependent methyltransferase [Aspergillus heteromorphus CBS 117.55]|uniref:S-adenosyl-L-methionine-dependent methyltransferase n=1 Tax=Aspergillus heteromorphus CBS 117.55 TaxID=1448321 RepID=A0A317VCC8_9EURO|nr:S-adenosyl-L-methionine-dependent methyltransferase [Aspergillus heteromorphus CBS 117.55]PWY70901.1 S-adenosyl-L-methionine-dependent methyltransferase [Aspergillus heteromorphus CBS 117.55]